MVALPALALLVALLGGWLPVSAQSSKQIKVLFEFRQSTTQSRGAVDGSGRVVITERGARSSGGVAVDSTQRRTQTSTGIFTLVQDGGESTLIVASQVPYPQVTFYRDYLTGAGYAVTSVQFKDVGTSLKVGATVLAGNQVRIRLTPTISWFSDDRSGVIEASEASTTLVVPSGQPVVLGGATTQTHELTRRILGYRASESGSETTMVLTATVR
jgi:hypothetical protein